MTITRGIGRHGTVASSAAVFRGTTRRRGRSIDRVQGAVGWTARAVVFASAVPIGGNVPVAWLALVAAAMVLFACQIVLDLLDGDYRLRLAGLAPVAVLYLAVVVWSVLQVAAGAPTAWLHESWEFVDGPGSIGIDPANGRHVVARLAAYGMLFWIAARFALEPTRAKACVAAIAVWSTAVAAYGIATLLFDMNWITGAEDPAALTATFVNRNSYATYAGFGLLANLAALSLAFESRPASEGTALRALRNALERLVAGAWIFALGTALVAAALILTISRGGILATVCGVAIFLLVIWRREAISAGSFSVGIIAALAVVYVATIGAAAFLTRLFASTAEEVRLSVYPRMIEAIGDRPLLGYGPGGFEDAFRPYLPAEAAAAGEWSMAHNSYLENALELGIPAAVLLYVVLFLVARRLWLGVRRRRRMLAIPAFALAAVIVAALHSIFDFSLQMPAAAALFAFILGLGWAQSSSSRLV